MSVTSTVETAVEQAWARLRRAGIAEARREAAGLWEAVTGEPRGAAWLRRSREANDAVLRRYEHAVARRATGVPFAYVVGSAPFRRIELAVDERVLIPRPETEGLVDHVLRWARARDETAGTAVDVGTGSGCIALSLAVEGPFARVIASDISGAALAVARGNAARIAAPVPVTFCRGDLLAPIRGPVEAIISNPPYVSEGEYGALDASVRDHEPATALVASDDGLAPTNVLLEAARHRLLTGGLLAIEVDSRRAPAVRERAVRLGWRDARIEADLFGRPRFFLATKE